MFPFSDTSKNILFLLDQNGIQPNQIHLPSKSLLEEIQQIFLFDISSEDSATSFRLMTPLKLSQELQKAIKVRLHYYQLQQQLSITDRISAEHHYQGFFNRVCDFCEAWVTEGLTEHLKQSRSEKDIKTLMRNLSLWLHPDKNEDEQEQEKKRAEGLFKTLLERIKEQLNKKTERTISQEERDILEKFKKTVLEMFKKHYGEEEEEWLKYYESYEKDQDRIIAAHKAYLAELKAENEELDKIGVKLREQEQERIEINREIEGTRVETAKVREVTAKTKAETANVRKVTSEANRRFDKLEKDFAESQSEATKFNEKTTKLEERFNQMQQVMIAMLQGASMEVARNMFLSFGMLNQQLPLTDIAVETQNCGLNK